MYTSIQRHLCSLWKDLRNWEMLSILIWTRTVSLDHDYTTLHLIDKLLFEMASYGSTHEMASYGSTHEMASYGSTHVKEDDSNDQNLICCLIDDMRNLERFLKLEGNKNTSMFNQKMISWVITMIAFLTTPDTEELLFEPMGMYYFGCGTNSLEKECYIPIATSLRLKWSPGSCLSCGDKIVIMAGNGTFYTVVGDEYNNFDKKDIFFEDVNLIKMQYFPKDEKSGENGENISNASFSVLAEFENIKFPGRDFIEYHLIEKDSLFKIIETLLDVDNKLVNFIKGESFTQEAMASRALANLMYANASHIYIEKAKKILGLGADLLLKLGKKIRSRDYFNSQLLENAFCTASKDKKETFLAKDLTIQVDELRKDHEGKIEKVYFEIELITCGDMELGWRSLYSSSSPDDFTFNGSAYVSDKVSDKDDVEYNLAKHWSDGDTVGVTLDLVEQKISFSLEEQDNIKSISLNKNNQNLHLVPCFQLDSSECICLNFGHKEFRRKKALDEKNAIFSLLKAARGSRPESSSYLRMWQDVTVDKEDAKQHDSEDKKKDSKNDHLKLDEVDIKNACLVLEQHHQIQILRGLLAWKKNSNATNEWKNIDDGKSEKNTVNRKLLECAINVTQSNKFRKGVQQLQEENELNTRQILQKKFNYLFDSRQSVIDRSLTHHNNIKQSQSYSPYEKSLTEVFDMYSMSIFRWALKLLLFYIREQKHNLETLLSIDTVQEGNKHNDNEEELNKNFNRRDIFDFFLYFYKLPVVSPVNDEDGYVANENKNVIELVKEIGLSLVGFHPEKFFKLLVTHLQTVQQELLQSRHLIRTDTSFQEKYALENDDNVLLQEMIIIDPLLKENDIAALKYVLKEVSNTQDYDLQTTNCCGDKVHGLYYSINFGKSPTLDKTKHKCTAFYVFFQRETLQRFNVCFYKADPIKKGTKPLAINKEIKPFLEVKGEQLIDDEGQMIGHYNPFKITLSDPDAEIWMSIKKNITTLDSEVLIDSVSETLEPTRLLNYIYLDKYNGLDSEWGICILPTSYTQNDSRRLSTFENPLFSIIPSKCLSIEHRTMKESHNYPEGYNTISFFPNQNDDLSYPHYKEIKIEGAKVLQIKFVKCNLGYSQFVGFYQKVENNKYRPFDEYLYQTNFDQHLYNNEELEAKSTFYFPGDTIYIGVIHKVDTLFTETTRNFELHFRVKEVDDEDTIKLYKWLESGERHLNKGCRLYPYRGSTEDLTLHFEFEALNAKMEGSKKILGFEICFVIPKLSIEQIEIETVDEIMDVQSKIFFSSDYPTTEDAWYIPADAMNLRGKIKLSKVKSEAFKQNKSKKPVILVGIRTVTKEPLLSIFPLIKERTNEMKKTLRHLSFLMQLLFDSTISQEVINRWKSKNSRIFSTHYIEKGHRVEADAQLFAPGARGFKIQFNGPCSIPDHKSKLSITGRRSTTDVLPYRGKAVEERNIETEDRLKHLLNFHEKIKFLHQPIKLKTFILPKINKSIRKYSDDKRTSTQLLLDWSQSSMLVPGDVLEIDYRMQGFSERACSGIEMDISAIYIDLQNFASFDGSSPEGAVPEKALGSFFTVCQVLTLQNSTAYLSLYSINF